jgi:hypothetical protein
MPCGLGVRGGQAAFWSFQTRRVSFSFRQVCGRCGPAFSARVFSWRKIPPGGEGGAPLAPGGRVALHMFRHVPPLAVLRVRRPLNPRLALTSGRRPSAARVHPDRNLCRRAGPALAYRRDRGFVQRLVGRLFRRGIIKIYQSSAEEALSLRA